MCVLCEKPPEKNVWWMLYVLISFSLTCKAALHQRQWFSWIYQFYYYSPHWPYSCTRITSKTKGPTIFLNYISINEIRISFCCFISQHTVSVSLGNFSSKWFFHNEIQWIHLSSTDFNIILSSKSVFFWCVLFCSKWAARHQLHQCNQCNLFTFSGKKHQLNKHLRPWKLSSLGQTYEFMFPQLFKVYPGIQRLHCPWNLREIIQWLAS